MKHRGLAPAARAGMALLLAAGTGTAAAGTVWQQDWEDSANLLDGWQESQGSQLQAADNGDFVIAQGHSGHNSLLRLSAAGSVQWRQNSGQSHYYGVGALVALADGSVAQLQTGGSFGAGYLSRTDAAGQPAWGIKLPAQRLVSYGSQLVAAGCYDNFPYASGVDAAGGSVLWQRRLSALPTVCSGNTLAVGGGAVYVGYPAAEGSGYVVTRLDSLGQTTWSITSPAVGTVRLAVNGSNVYLLAQGTLSALRASDGGALWQKPCSDYQLHFVGADPLCTSSGTVKRLGAAGGGEVWSHAVSGGSILGVFEGNVYFRDGLSWQRWAGGSGSGEWQAPLAATATYRPEVWQSGTGAIAFLSAPLNPDDYLLKRYRLSDGAEISSAPLPPQQRGVAAAVRLRDGADLFLYGKIASPATPARVRRIGAGSGNLLWEAGSATAYSAPSLAVTDSRVYASGRAAFYSRVNALNRSDGAPLWTRDILYVGSNSEASARPGLLTLAGGDAVALNAFYHQPPGGWGYRETHYALRLNSADGTPVWDRDFSARDVPQPVDYDYPPIGLAFGDDVIIAPATTSLSASLPLQRVAAASGDPVWSVTLTQGVHTLARAPGEQAFFAFSANREAGSSFSLSKRDAASGAVLWQFSQNAPNGRRFELNKLLPLAGGDVLLVGNMVGGTPPALTSSGRVLRVKSDGSGLRYVWAAGGNPAMSIDSIGDFAIDAAGQAWMFRLHTDRRLGAHFLARFDLQQGRVLGSQIHRPAYVQPLFPLTYWALDLMPFQGEQFLATGDVIRPPQAATQRIALRDFSVVRRGDLAVNLPSLPESFPPGTWLPVAARVSYSGDGPISGATLILDPPWQGTALEFGCSGSGISNCSVETRYGQIVARFDAEPGARLELSGQVRALAWPDAAGAAPRAVIYGPEELLESDSSNNFHVASASAPIFADGFQ